MRYLRLALRQSLCRGGSGNWEAKLTNRAGTAESLGITADIDAADALSLACGNQTTEHALCISQVLHGAGIFAYIYPKNGPNVGKYSRHGAYGYGDFPIERSISGGFSIATFD